MAKLAEILKQEYKTKGLVSGLSSAVVKRLREKVDIRNVLFGGTGVGSQIGRKVFGKGYSAIKDKPDLASKVKPVGDTESLNVQMLGEILKSTTISAKNSVVLPYMARDMNLVKLNIMRLVKVMGGKSTKNTDIFFKDAKERENIYESQFRRTNTKSPSIINPEKPEGRKNIDSILDDIIAGTLISKLIQKIIPLVLVALKAPAAFAGLLGIVSAIRLAYDNGLIGNRSLASEQKYLLESDIRDSATPEKRKKRVKELENMLDPETGQKFSEDKIEDFKSGKKIAYRKYNPTLGKNETVIETPEQALAYLNEMEKAENKPLTNLTINNKKVVSGVTPPPTKVYDESLPKGVTVDSNQVIKYFVDKGYTPEQASGIAGNLMQESSLNSGAQGKEAGGYISYGLAQWNKDRLANLKKYAEDTGRSISDPNLQLDFISKELDTIPAYGKKELKQAKTPAEAANTFAKLYERPKTVENTRLEKAKQSYEEYKNTSKSKITPIPDTTFDELEDGYKPKVGFSEEIGASNQQLKPTLANEPKIPSNVIQSASNNFEDVKRESLMPSSPTVINSPVTNNNVMAAGGSQSKGYDSAKSGVYDTELITLLQRTT